jgi:hypothetical protein
MKEHAMGRTCVACRGEERVRWAEHVLHVEESISAFRVFFGENGKTETNW